MSLKEGITILKKAMILWSLSSTNFVNSGLIKLDVFFLDFLRIRNCCQNDDKAGKIQLNKSNILSTCNTGCCFKIERLN
jgi:hypothetical protein